MKRYQLFAFVFTVVVVAILGGCLSAATSGTRIQDGVIITNNAAFASHFKAHRDACIETSEGFLRVQVRLENLERADRQLQYRFQWFDENGMEMTMAKPLWKVLSINGCDIVALESTCPLQGAKDFRLDLRPL